MPFFTFTESKRRGVLLEVKQKKKTVLGRNSFSYGGTVVWNSLNKELGKGKEKVKELGKARCFESSIEP